MIKTNIILYLQKYGIQIAFQIWKEKMMRKQEKILKSHVIDTYDWDPEFKNHFKSVNAKSLSKEQMSKRLKNCIATNYWYFDEYVKTTELCKKNIEENEKSVCVMYLKKI